MSLSLYQISIPTFIAALNNLSAILTKAEAHAAEKKIDPSVFITSRLAPDMFPLSRQVQIAADMVKGGGARLAGVDLPSYADTEVTFPDLQARLAKTIAFLNTLTPEQIDGREDAAIQLKVGGHEMNFKGLQYLQGFVLPNLYFHSTAAYCILRHNGVNIGKMDFIGKL